MTELEESRDGGWGKEGKVMGRKRGKGEIYVDVPHALGDII